MTTLETLQDILVSEYKVDPAQLTPESELSAIGLDSLSVVELLFKIEDAFELTIVDDAPTNLRTVGDVVEYIDEPAGPQTGVRERDPRAARRRRCRVASPSPAWA